jgi:hypothetical protein
MIYNIDLNNGWHSKLLESSSKLSVVIFTTLTTDANVIKTFTCVIYWYVLHYKLQGLPLYSSMIVLLISYFTANWS